MRQIDWQNTILEIRPHLDLCCWTPEDATELIQAASLAAQHKMTRISVAAASVPSVWSWLEKSHVALSAMVAWNSEKAGFDDLVKEIMVPLKRGADSLQLFVKFGDLKTLAESLGQIRDEIFFDKKLSVALSLDEVPYNGWAEVFEHLDTLRADNLMLISKNIQTMDAKYYNFLDSLPEPKGWGIEVCAASDSIKPLEDIFRLTQKMMPDLLDSLRIIVRPEFMKKLNTDSEDEDL